MLRNGLPLRTAAERGAARNRRAAAHVATVPGRSVVACLTAVVALGLAASGCGSSSSSGGGSSPGATPASSGGGGSSGGSSSGGGGKGTILIGTIAGTTGAYGSTGVAMVNGATLAVQDMNAAGGVGGRKFSLTTANDNASATVASQEYQKMVSGGAVAITGSGDTGPATAAMSDRLQIPDIGVVDDAGITVYPKGPSQPPLPWAWSFGLNTFAWGATDAAYALKNCKALAVLHDPTTYGGGGDDAIKLAYKNAGKSIALDEAITENWSTGATVGLNSELNKIKSAGADCVVVWLTPQDTAAFVQATHSAGDNFTILGNDEINADNTFANLAGAQADGAIGATITALLTPSAALKDFMSRYQAQFHVAATPFAEATYDSVKMLAQVIKDNGGKTDPKSLQTGLNNVKDFPGLTGTLTLSPTKHATIDESQLTTVKYVAAKKQWVPLTSGG
jgi:ABC-type branched-subunit amino acid transport system substrate-binding protein